MGRLAVLMNILTNLTRLNDYQPGQQPVPQTDYSEKFFTQTIDHFDYVNINQTFKQRYIISEEHWCEGCPIFLYLGNEADIKIFVNNTGFIWENAKSLRAMVLFVEHRYYGKSIPFGKLDFHLDKIGYLSVDQCLADFAHFIRFIKKSKPKAKNSPIILFGGSYGGMLAFWHRLKYPFLSAGALASSAPILLFSGRYDCNSYDNQVTIDFDGYSKDCSHSIKNSWPALRQLLKTKDGREWLYRTFHLCKPLTEKDQDTFIWWVADTWRNLAMVDYANPANFIANLPAYPIGEVCEHLDQPDAPGKQLAQKVYQAISVYYNYTGDLKCNNINYDLQSEIGPAWDFQACTEIIMPVCDSGKTDMFEPQPWNPKTYSEDCHKKYGIRPDFDKIVTEFGGKDYTTVTNVIFTNGMRDPWYKGGGSVLHTNNNAPTQDVINIPMAVHQEDLRPCGPNDTPQMKAARQEILRIIKIWIIEYYGSIENCPKELQGYLKDYVPESNKD